MESYGRWPPIYDAEDLANTITLMAGRADLESVFFDSPAKGGAYCQGDVLQLASGAPVHGSFSWFLGESYYLPQYTRKDTRQHL